MAPHSGTLAWKIPGPEEPSGLPSMGSHRVGHDWSDFAAAATSHAAPQWQITWSLQLFATSNHAYDMSFFLWEVLPRSGTAGGHLAAKLPFQTLPLVYTLTRSTRLPCTHLPPAICFTWLAFLEGVGLAVSSFSDQGLAPALGVCSPNHWTAREFPFDFLFLPIWWVLCEILFSLVAFRLLEWAHKC